MSKPKMMIFDYGHTLCYEPEQDYARGWRAAMEHAVENPRGITAEQLYEYSRGVYAGLFAAMRPLELETDGLKLDESIFDALGLRFDVSMQELEYIRSDARWYVNFAQEELPLIPFPAQHEI